MTNRDVRVFDHVLITMFLAPRSRFWLAALLIAMLFTGCKPPTESNSEVGETNDFNDPKLVNYPAGVSPGGTFAVKVERQAMPYQRLVSIGDGGELLFNPNYEKSFFSISKGVTKEIQRTDSGLWPKMMPDGHIDMSHGSSVFSSTYPFDQDRSDPGYFNDGSSMVIDVANMPGEKRAVYTLNRKWYRPEPEHTKMGDKVIELRSEIIFRAPNRIAFLEKSDTGVIWVQDHHGTEHHGTDQLIRIEKGRQERISMPPGYENVQRIAQTKDMVVGTFGIYAGAKPFRNFLRVGSDWKELPIPTGYVMSFVQTVFYDGTILGYVTSSDAKKMRNVLWKADKVAILDEQPGWPKQGNMSQSILSNRNGLLSVRDGMAPGVASLGDYLIKVTPKE